MSSGIRTMLLMLVIVILTMVVHFPPAWAIPLQVVYTEWFPYTHEENGKASGFEIETFQSVIKKMSLQAKFTIYPWNRCLDSLKKGKADVLISLLKTPEREEFTFFPEEPISISKTVFLTKADKDIQYTGSLEELKGYSIGVIMGFSYGEAFDKAVYLQKDESIDTQMLITKLINNRNQIVAENQAVVNGTAQKMGATDKIKFLSPPIHSQKLYVGFSKANNLKTLCENFSKALEEFRKTDEYKVILEKYGVKYSEMVEK